MASKRTNWQDCGIFEEWQRSRKIVNAENLSFQIEQVGDRWTLCVIRNGESGLIYLESEATALAMRKAVKQKIKAGERYNLVTIYQQIIRRAHSS